MESCVRSGLDYSTEYNEQFRYAGRAGNLGARLNPGDFGGTAAAIGAEGQASGREWQLAGAALTGTAGVAAAIYDDYNTAKAQSAVNGLQKNFLAWQAEMSQKKGEAAMEAGAEYEQWQQRQMAELTRGMNEIQRGRFAALAEVKAAGFQKWAADYGSEQGLVYRNAEDAAGIRTEAENLAANLANVDMAKASEERIKDLAFRIGQRKGLGEEASKALMRDSLAEAVTPAIAAQIAAGKLGTARTALAHYENAIGAANALKLQAAIAREAERQQAKAEANRRKAVAETLEGLEDATYSAQYMGDTTPLHDMAARLLKLGDTQRAERLSRQAELWKTHTDARQFAATSPLGEVASAITDLDGQLEEGRKNGTDLETFQRLAEKREALAEVYASRARALKSDPALAADSDPSVVPPDGATLADKVALRLEYQAANGLAASKRQPLTGDEAARLQEQWQSAGPDQRAALLYGKESVVAQFGRHALPVLRQIGVSPLEQDLARSVVENPGGVANARAVFKVLSLNEKDIPDVPVKDELQEVLNESSVYRGYRKMALATASPEAARATRQFEQAASRLLKLGRAPEEAQRMLDNGRQGVTDANMALTLPPGQSADALELRLARTLEEKLPALLAGHPDLSPLEREERLRQLKHTGLWVNAPTGDGYILLDAVSGLPVTDGKGHTLSVESEEAFHPGEDAGLDSLSRVSNGLTGGM